jgi:hypothetical protein
MIPDISSTKSKNISLVLYRRPVVLHGIGDENGVAAAFARLMDMSAEFPKII